jgi:hypothetical protein
MRTYLYNVVDKGNYPWKELLAKLEADYKSVTPAFVARIENFVKANPTRWISKEIQTELNLGNLPTDWQIKEMEKSIAVLAKKNAPKTAKPKVEVKKEEKVIPATAEATANPIANFVGALSKEKFELLSVEEKKEYSKNIFKGA